ncbi:uncharacterized protein [Penaeus vannamei]|nr:uncharacterized protein LOC113829428 isoform X1 [Penaeus vannamei]
MKMSDMHSKKRHDGYNPFDADEMGSSLGSSGVSEEADNGVMAFLRRFCGCLCPRPEHPLLSSSVTHRKISRVASTDSLAKEGIGILERPPTSRPTPQEQLAQARAQHRLYSALTPTAFAQAPYRESDSQKPSWPALPPVAPPRKTHAPQAASSPASRPLPDALAFHAHPNSLTSNALISRSTLSLDTDCQLATPPVLTPMGSPRLERASSLQGVANVSASNYSTPTGESPATTPTTPRTKMANWSAVISGLNHLMKSKADHPPPFSQPDEERKSSDDEAEDMPEPACVRPAAGGVADPAKECYGAVTLKVLSRQGRWVRVLVCGLSGLPWVGGSGGLMLEVNIEPGGRPRWLVLPHAHGPNVNVKLEAVVKQPREIKTKKKFLVKVGVWVCGRVWRHAALGHALTPLREPGNPVTAQLLHHTQLTEDLGLVEVSLRCDYSDNLMKQVVGTSMAEVILTLEVLRAKNLRPFNPGLLSKAKHSKKKEHAEVVCRVGLWVKGERVERKSSTSVKLPVTHDPVIRNRSVFNIPRDHLQNAALIVKVLYTSKWAGEDTVGRVKLGPLLYLGTSPDQASVNPQPDYNTSITLSHWGQALKTPGPVTMWHHLQL